MRPSAEATSVTFIGEYLSNYGEFYPDSVHASYLYPYKGNWLLREFLLYLTVYQYPPPPPYLALFFFIIAPRP